MSRNLSFLWFATVVVCVALPAAAADNMPPEGFTALFNGRDLSGWKDDETGHWRAQDGVLVYDGQSDHLFTEKAYGDFVLLIDWKIEDGGNSGIFLRGEAQVEIWDNRDYGTDMGSGGIVRFARLLPAFELFEFLLEPMPCPAQILDCLPLFRGGGLLIVARSLGGLVHVLRGRLDVRSRPFRR